jgi:hypothetical protein
MGYSHEAEHQIDTTVPAELLHNLDMQRKESPSHYNDKPYISTKDLAGK